MPSRAGIFLLVLLAAATVRPAECRADSATGRIRILFLGEYYFWNTVFLDWLVAEPRFSLAVVPCSTQHIQLGEAKKLTRLYIPRTLNALVTGYDAMMFEDFGPLALETWHIENFRRAVEEAGLGLGLIEFANWGAGSNYMDMWMKTTLYQAFPAEVDMSTDIPADKGRIYYKILRRDPIFNLPGIEQIPINSGHQGDLYPRLGSVVDAEWKGRGTPALVTGKFGKGKTLQIDHGWDNMRNEVRIWEYGPDLVYNQVLFVAGEPVAGDLDALHRARKLFVEIRIRKVITVSTLEFIEEFGGKVGVAERKFAALEEQVKDAREAYVMGNDPQTAADLLSEVFEQYPLLEVEMMKIKKDALMWVYVIEWCVVSATSTLAGVLVWTLMVRRTLYREVTTTRAGQS